MQNYLKISIKIVQNTFWRLQKQVKTTHLDVLRTKIAPENSKNFNKTSTIKLMVYLEAIYRTQWTCFMDYFPTSSEI